MDTYTKLNFISVLVHQSKFLLAKPHDCLKVLVAWHAGHTLEHVPLFIRRFMQQQCHSKVIEQSMWEIVDI